MTLIAECELHISTWHKEYSLWYIVQIHGMVFYWDFRAINKQTLKAKMGMPRVTHLSMRLQSYSLVMTTPSIITARHCLDCSRMTLMAAWHSLYPWLHFNDVPHRSLLLCCTLWLQAAISILLVQLNVHNEILFATSKLVCSLICIRSSMLLPHIYSAAWSPGLCDRLTNPGVSLANNTTSPVITILHCY